MLSGVSKRQKVSSTGFWRLEWKMIVWSLQTTKSVIDWTLKITMKNDGLESPNDKKVSSTGLWRLQWNMIVWSLQTTKSVIDWTLKITMKNDCLESPNDKKCHRLDSEDYNEKWLSGVSKRQKVSSTGLWRFNEKWLSGVSERQKLSFFEMKKKTKKKFAELFLVNLANTLSWWYFFTKISTPRHIHQKSRGGIQILDILFGSHPPCKKKRMVFRSLQRTKNWSEVLSSAWQVCFLGAEFFHLEPHRKAQGVQALARKQMTSAPFWWHGKWMGNTAFSEKKKWKFPKLDCQSVSKKLWKKVVKTPVVFTQWRSLQAPPRWKWRDGVVTHFQSSSSTGFWAAWAAWGSSKTLSPQCAEGRWHPEHSRFLRC